MDGIIAPIQATPAVPHGYVVLNISSLSPELRVNIRAITTLSALAAGTILYNVIDSPVGILPVTRVDPIEDQITEDWLKGPGHGSKMFERGLYHEKNAPYNPEKMKGLPVGVQVVGRSFEEEKVVEMMKVIDRALGPRDFGSKVRPQF